jgi:casein kinase II subunit beta
MLRKYFDFIALFMASALISFPSIISQSFASDSLIYSPWVTAFSERAGNELYLKVPNSFIIDPVTISCLNTLLNGINQTYSKHVLDYILIISDSHCFPKSKKFIHQNKLATDYYNILHSLFVVSPQGLLEVKKMFKQKKFGECLRVYCDRFPLIPVGFHDQLRRSKVKLFCPKCRDIYYPTNIRTR